MTEKLIFCACCYNAATHQGSDGLYRCDLHRLNGDIAPFDTSVVDMLRAENDRLKAKLAALVKTVDSAVDNVDHRLSRCSIYNENNSVCDCGVDEIRAALADAKVQP